VITETPHDDTKNEFGIKAYNLRLPTIDSRLHCHCERPARQGLAGGSVAISLPQRDCFICIGLSIM
jgi:hypothetical protein